MNAAFQDSLQFGQVGENHIARWLRSRGYHVLPVYEKEIDNGKGPRLFMASTCKYPQLIAPDMLALRGSSILWVEAKRKTRFSWYGIGGYWVTGIDERHYRDYCAVQDETEYPVWLMFLHTESTTWPNDVVKWGAPSSCPTGLFGNQLSALRENESHRSTRHAHGMVYWPLSRLHLLAHLNDVMPSAEYAVGCHSAY